ncbi:phosphate ABC transporter substrate-binding/OmpA family protein [Sorangium sp. So ce1128]
MHAPSSGAAGSAIVRRSGPEEPIARARLLAWGLGLVASMVLGAVISFLFFRATPPEIVGPTATVTPPPPPAVGQPLRLHGSNTLGAELVPALAEGFLRHEGAVHTTRAKGEDGHAWVVSGVLPGAKETMRIEIDTAGSETAFTGLARGACDLGMASRPVQPQEQQELRAAGAGEVASPAQEHVIGLDGIAIVVHPENALREMTMADVAALFSGETSSWPPTSKVQGPVRVYARDEASGTFSMFKMLALGDRPLVASARRLRTNEEVAAAVAADEGGVGFVDMVDVGRATAVALSDGGAAALVPTPFTVKTEDYPLSRRLFLYSPRPPRHPLAAKLVEFALSDDGQRIVASTGFVDLHASDISRPHDSCAAGPRACPASYASAARTAKRTSVTFRFQPGNAQLDSRGQHDVLRLANALRAQRHDRVLLFGFSDGQGLADVNLRLSRVRAEQVAAALKVQGLRVEAVEGLGAAMPIASDSTPEGRERNRRVEVWALAAP